MRRLADRLVRWIARTATLGWFRAVEVTGLDRIPRRGPVLLVANHHGGFVDPALLVATVPRSVRFLAMASLFRILPLRPLLALAGTIPVHRTQDAAGGAGALRNVDAFAACFAHLRDGGVIGIFPEGQASDEPHLLPVRTGAARIALGAHSRGAMGLTIVPVGLIYEDKQRARSRAYVRVGDPIVMDEDLATNPAVPPDESDGDAVIALTKTIEERLADAALDFETAEQRSALRMAANVELRWEHGDPRGRPPVGEVERLADRLSEVHPVAEAAIRAAATDYREGLAAAGVSDAVVAPGAETAFARRSRAGWVLTVALAPLAAAGLLANAAPTALVYAVGRRPLPPVTHATAKFLTAIVGFSANWTALRWWVFDEKNRVPVALHAHRGSRVRPRRALVRGQGDPGAAGTAGPPPSGRCGRRARGPPRPPRPSRPCRPSCDGRDVARSGAGDMNGWHPEVRKLLPRLTDGQELVLGDDLLGSYVFGSVATGDFEPDISDVDAATVLRADPTPDQLNALGRLHQAIVEEMPAWEDRIEVVYLSSRALAMFRTASWPAARISPGEPFHAIDVDRRWLIDWYQLREVGIALRGPAIDSLVPEITHGEYVEEVRQHLLTWRDSLDDLESQGDQAYAVLTMCRGFRTVRTGEHVSKREAARWASEELPEHADLIRDALEWRERSRGGRWIDGAATHEPTVRFLESVFGLLR
jgi:1-acyl-sn-glycerol-3-phosphate acyltransferase